MKRGSLVALGITLASASAAEARQTLEETRRTELETAMEARGVDPADLELPTVLSASVRSWLAEAFDDRWQPELLVSRLLDLLVSPSGLEIRWVPGYTGTASEVFESREANCLAFTHLFVSLARSLDVPAYYVHYPGQVHYSKEGDLAIVSEHVSAAYNHGPQRILLDFGVIPAADRPFVQPISDLTAMAIHHSNRGAELLGEGDSLQAVAWLERSVQLDPAWPDAWGNLGVARRRAGDFPGAESAYRKAIAIDSNHVASFQNLAALLWRQGKGQEAESLLRALGDQRSRNPFVYLGLGDLAKRAGRQRMAGEYYRRARRLGPKIAAIRAAYGLWALDNGKRRMARTALSEAAALDSEDSRVLELKRRLEPSS